MLFTVALSIGGYWHVEILAAKEGAVVEELEILPSEDGKVHVPERRVKIDTSGRVLRLLVDSSADTLRFRIPVGSALYLNVFGGRVIVRQLRLSSLGMFAVAERVFLESSAVRMAEINLIDTYMRLHGDTLTSLTLGVINSQILIEKSHIDTLNLKASGGRMVMRRSDIRYLRKLVKDFKLEYDQP
ncbi:MAG: hypothetical protein GXO39_08465 [Thermotogae bacterium]|nr:hypothetical protein [Thermotogota bacterium]